jgi:hypothetical protein
LLFPRVARLTALHCIRGLLTGGMSLAIVLALPAHAEDPPRRVGSLNYISGEVNYALRAEGGDPGVLSWSAADFNQPVCQDMSLQTATLARARIRIGPNAIQMSSDTLLDVLNLNNNLIEASIPQGRIHLQLRDLGDAESVEIEIPRGSLWLLQSGAYDIETPGSSDQPARITVFEGKARFVGGAADVLIAAGEEVQVTGAYPAIVTTQRGVSGANPTPTNDAPAPPGPGSATAEPPAATAGTNPARADVRSAAPVQANSGPTEAQSAPSDDFLSWVETSETDATPPESPRHASVQMTGYEGLDQYGRWQALDDYGPVWFPTAVPPDWAPYRFGHWASILPWGWTWIDDQPWGFAPFHYGRWVYVDDRWGWAPGTPVDYPTYAPALVAFMEMSEGAGPDAEPVGWFPLAPGDAFIPWYEAGPAYIEGVNAVYWGRFHDAALRWREEHGREIWRGELANRRLATFVSREAFAHGRAVEREMIRVPAERLDRAMVMRGAPRVMPAVMRTMAGPGGLHTEPRGIAPGMAGPAAPRPGAPGSGGFHGGPHGPTPGMAADRGPRGEPRVIAATGRSNPGGFARPGGGQSMPQGYGRPEAFHTPAPTYRPGMYGQPQVARMPQMMGRGMPTMMGRGMPQVAARPALGGGGAALRKK